MRYTWISLALLLLPAVAHADRIRVTSYDMDDRGGTVRLESDAPVGEPWLRIEGRTIKIWFPHVVDVSRFDHERESSDPIRSLALRGGASDTALLRVELGTNHHIEREDIVISRDGLRAAIKLSVPSAQPAAAPSAPVAPQTQVLAASAAVPGAPETAPTVMAAQPQPAPKEPAATASQPAQPKEDLSDIGADAASEGLGMLDEQEADSKPQNPIWMLGVASVLLAFVWFGLQRLQRSKAVYGASIEVIGSRRLGHRQELLIVRALGADHLLLCTGGRAEHVASTPNALALPASPPTPALAPRSVSAEPASDPAKATSTQAGGINLMSRLSSQHRLRKLLDSVNSETPDNEQHESDNEFNDELLTATRKRGALLHSLPAPAARQSEAVAGITRLRQRKSS